MVEICRWWFLYLNAAVGKNVLIFFSWGVRWCDILVVVFCFRESASCSYRHHCLLAATLLTRCSFVVCDFVRYHHPYHLVGAKAPEQAPSQAHTVVGAQDRAPCDVYMNVSFDVTGYASAGLGL